MISGLVLQSISTHTVTEDADTWKQMIQRYFSEKRMQSKYQRACFSEGSAGGSAREHAFQIREL